MSLFNLLSSVLRPVTTLLNDIPARLTHDLVATSDTVTDVTNPDAGDTDTPVDVDTPTTGDDVTDEDQDTGNADNDPDQGDVTDPDGLDGDQETGDADNDTDEGDVTDPDDILDDQETGNPDTPTTGEDPDQDTGNADNDTDKGDVTDPDGILDDQETGDADNDTVGGDVTDPEDILDDQETGNPDTPVAEPVSDPVLGDVRITGQAAADGVVTFDEKAQNITVSFEIDGVAADAAVNATVTIDGQTYVAQQTGGTWSANVPVTSLNEGEINGTVSVKTTDANGAVLTRQTSFDSDVMVDFTEPTPVSEPEFSEVTITGDAAEDGTITFDEASETVQVSVSVIGIAEGATAEVTFSIDGQSYTASEVDGKWVADVSVMNLSNGTVSGAVAIKVTDADGTVKTEASSFNTDVVVDLTEPVVNSNPVIDAVTVGGEILADGTLTSDELNETFEVQVEVSGIEDGASVEVSVEVDGNVYQATNENGVYIAEVPASELSDGTASGTASVKVTDANGETSHASSNFNTTIETDFSNPDDGVFGPEVQSTGEVEMDLDSMKIYTSGKGEMGVESDFNITVKFSNGGNVSNEIKASVIQMTEYISSVIQNDMEGFSTFFEDVDDFLLTVGEISFDGEGGVHGAGSVTAFRTEGSDVGMASQGTLAIDPADVASMMNEGVFNDIVLHEILHALGFGSGEQWEKFLEASQEYGGSFRFTGESAIAAYNAQHPEIASQDDFANFGVPIESDFGRGNAGSHWDRATFDKTEGGLMATGTSEFYYGGIDAMTLAAFEDMGYETTWDASNPAADPGDYDALPAAVQDPDLANDAQLAFAEDLDDASDVSAMAAAEDVTEAEAVPEADDASWSIADLLEGIAEAVNDTVTGDDAAEEGLATNLLDMLLGGLKGEAEISFDTSEGEADMFADAPASTDQVVDFGMAIDAGAIDLQSSIDMMQPVDEFMG